MHERIPNEMINMIEETWPKWDQNLFEVNIAFSEKHISIFFLADLTRLINKSCRRNIEKRMRLHKGYDPTVSALN